MSNANEPAFAGLQFDDMPGGGARIVQVGGLTKREYFAAMAMQAIITKTPPCNEAHDISECTRPGRYAKVATACADALIAELERTA